ncbi:MAG: hypothetical protein R3A10_06330 [Caldilineaceae bacterium]
MVLILGALIAGGAIASSVGHGVVFAGRGTIPTNRVFPSGSSIPWARRANRRQPWQQRTNQALAASSVALGATVAGAFTNPVLLLAGLPVSIYVFAPTFHEAWRTVRAERRVTSPLLDATRVTVCLVMGFYGTLALDAWLRTLTARVLLRTEDDFIRMLDARLPAAPPTVWRHIGDVEVQQTVADSGGRVISSMTGRRTRWTASSATASSGPTCARTARQHVPAKCPARKRCAEMWGRTHGRHDRDGRRLWRSPTFRRAPGHERATASRSKQRMRVRPATSGRKSGRTMAPHARWRLRASPSLLGPTGRPVSSPPHLWQPDADVGPLHAPEFRQPGCGTKSSHLRRRVGRRPM